jgi:hypothetical protein
MIDEISLRNYKIRQYEGYSWVSSVFKPAIQGANTFLVLLQRTSARSGNLPHVNPGTGKRSMGPGSRGVGEEQCPKQLEEPNWDPVEGGNPAGQPKSVCCAPGNPGQFGG